MYQIAYIGRWETLPETAAAICDYDTSKLEVDVYKRQDLHIRSGAWSAQHCNCSAWRGCAYYLFPAEWCDFAGYGIFDQPDGAAAG